MDLLPDHRRFRRSGRRHGRGGGWWCDRASGLRRLRSRRGQPGLGLRPAALVLTRVVSHPAPDLATCDAGSKSIAAEAGDPCAEVLHVPKPSTATMNFQQIFGKRWEIWGFLA